MRVLVLNCGSSSIKFELRRITGGSEADAVTAGATEADSVLAEGLVGRVGDDGSFIEIQTGGEDDPHERRQEVPVPGHGRGLELIVDALVDPSAGVLNDLSEVSAVGHRVVHGGRYFTAPALVTSEVIARIEEEAHLAPLHNPPTLLGIREALRILPDIPHVAVFDTGFHATLPETARVYALPYRFYEENGVRRYGFHGISVASVAQKLDRLLAGRLKESKAIIAHLGNGASITALDRGRSVDTSMGLTPLEGLVMGTRPGDLDAGVVLFLIRDLGLSPDEVDRVLSEESGLLGLSGVSNDMRDVETDASKGDARCRLALDVYAYRVKKYIGAYAAAMGGLDALVFTAGVGENDPDMRAAICEGLQFLGIGLDTEVNAATRGVEGDIGAAHAKVRVFVVPTDEEGLIARETWARIDSSHRPT